MKTVTRADVEQEIFKQRLILSKLCSQMNTFSSVFRLPTETLADIFIHCASDHYHDGLRNGPGWLSISYVCRRWRDIALDCPALWTCVPAMSARWIEEFLIRSKQASLKMHITFLLVKDTSRWMKLFEMVAKHTERILELVLDFPSPDILSKLSSRAPRLENLKITMGDPSFWLSPPLFDGDTPALRSLELSRCPISWRSLKLSGLTTLKLHQVPVRPQQNFVQSIATLHCMQNLKYLHLIRTLPYSQDFISSTMSNPFSRINLPHLSRLFIEEPLSTVNALLSCVNIPLSTEIKLNCPDVASVGDYMLLSSLLGQRFGMLEDQACTHPAIRSLVIGFDEQDPQLTFSTSERDCNPRYFSITEWDCNVLLQVVFSRLRLDHGRLVSDVCCSIPLTYVQSVHVVELPPSPALSWKSIFEHLQDLRYLKLSGGEMPMLLPILSLDPVIRTDPNKIYAPALEELELEDMIFGPWADQQSLEAALSTRKNRQVRFTVTDCVAYSDDESDSEIEL